MQYTAQPSPSITYVPCRGVRITLEQLLQVDYSKIQNPVFEADFIIKQNNKADFFIYMTRSKKPKDWTRSFFLVKEELKLQRSSVVNYN